MTWDVTEPAKIHIRRMRISYKNLSDVDADLSPDLEIVVQVSILTFSLPLACDSALDYQILCKSDDPRREYPMPDLSSIFQRVGHSHYIII